MEKLTRKEEELMKLFWNHGPMFVREAVALYPDPKPHVNTVSTTVRSLESKGYLAHEDFGSTYRYYPAVSEHEFGTSSLKGIVNRYFDNSYLGVVSTLVKEEKISVEELRRLIERIESQETKR